MNQVASEQGPMTRAVQLPNRKLFVPVELFDLDDTEADSFQEIGLDRQATHHSL
jgi:hypothetical protein